MSYKYLLKWLKPFLEADFIQFKFNSYEYLSLENPLHLGNFYLTINLKAKN